MEKVPEIYDPEEPEYPDFDSPEGDPEDRWQDALVNAMAALSNNVFALVRELRALRGAKP